MGAHGHPPAGLMLLFETKASLGPGHEGHAERCLPRTLASQKGRNGKALLSLKTVTRLGVLKHVSYFGWSAVAPQAKCARKQVTGSQEQNYLICISRVFTCFVHIMVWLLLFCAGGSAVGHPAFRGRCLQVRGPLHMQDPGLSALPALPPKCFRKPQANLPIFRQPGTDGR